MSKVVAKVGLKILGFATLFGNEAKDELALGTSTTKTNRGGSECASKQARESVRMAMGKTRATGLTLISGGSLHTSPAGDPILSLFAQGKTRAGQGVCQA